jgi:hypothetical protein
VPHAKTAAVESRIGVNGSTASIRGSGIAVGDVKPLPDFGTSGRIDFTRVGGVWKITDFAE